MSALWLKNTGSNPTGASEFFLDFICNCLSYYITVKIFHLYSLTAVHSYMYDLYHIHFTSFSSYNGYKLNSHLTCFLRGFIAQLVEHHHTSITEVMGLNPIRASEFFLGFICNCLSCYITAKISFTCIEKYYYTATLISLLIDKVFIIWP